LAFITVYRNRLLQAIQLAVLDLEDGHAPDPFRYSDYNVGHPGFLERIALNLRRGLLRPGLPLELTFPKSEFAVRPGRRIEIEDLAVVYYCILALAEDLEERLKPGVTAYRVRTGPSPRIVQSATLILPKSLRKKLSIVEPWYNAWPSFIRSLRRDYTKFGRKFVGTSDITSFYEDVDLGLLRNELRARVSKNHQPLANILVEMYQAWSARDIHLIRQNRGLPQGTCSSGVIANYYLMSFDDALSKFARTHNLRWYRYNDDMRLMGANREDVKRGLRIIGQQLSRLNLIQQGSKTKILTGRPARQDLFDTRPEKIEKLIRKIQRLSPLTKGSRRAALRNLDRYLKGVLNTDDKRDSTVLVMLYRGYAELESDRLLPRWQADYKRQPTRARAILSYLSRFLNRPGQCKALARVLTTQRFRATDWEVAQFARCCRRMNHLPDLARRTLNSLAQSKSSNWYVRQQAVLALGWLGLSGEVRQLARILFTEWDEEVRRAILTVIFLLPSTEEDELLKQASRDETLKVSRMANYLLALRENPTLALATLKQFTKPNVVFFCDNFWKLYQIRRNTDKNTQSVLKRTLVDTSAELAGKFPRRHLRLLSGKAAF
jgi:hypothetical protein